MDAGGRMFQKFIKLWQALPKEGGNVPAKACFSPTLAPRLMPNLFVAEHKARFDLEVRLLGTEIESRPTFRVSGENLFSRLHEDDWEYFEDFLAAYRKHPCAARVKRRVTGGDRVYDLHTLGAPLMDADGNASFIMGVGYAETNMAESEKAQKKREAGRRASPDKLAVPVICAAAFIDLGYGVPTLKLDRFNRPH